jgi:hypothetical protein
LGARHQVALLHGGRDRHFLDGRGLQEVKLLDVVLKPILSVLIKGFCGLEKSTYKMGFSWTGAHSILNK